MIDYLNNDELQIKFKNLLKSFVKKHPGALESLKGEQQLPAMIRVIEDDLSEERREAEFRKNNEQEIAMHQVRVLEQARYDLTEQFKDISELVSYFKSDFIGDSWISADDKKRLLADTNLIRLFVESMVCSESEAIDYFLSKLLLARHCLQQADDQLWTEARDRRKEMTDGK